MTKTKKDPEAPYYKNPTPGKQGKWNLAGKASNDLRVKG